jgi:hypothetical protein
MSFKSPWLLLGLLVLALAIGLWVLAERRRARYTVRYTNLDVLATVASGRSWLRYVPSALVALGLAVLIVGIARPEVNRTLVKERATVILVVDTSRSMQAKDVEPTRLGAAQEALRTFLDQAPRDLRVGLVVFAGEAQVATPPTKDHALVDTAITDIDQFLVYGGTAIGDALQTAVLLGRQVTDLAQTDEDGITAPDATSSTRSRPGVGTCGERRVRCRSSSSPTVPRRVAFCSRSRARSSRRRHASPSTPSRSERRRESSSAARSAAFPGTRRRAR